MKSSKLSVSAVAVGLSLGGLTLGLGGCGGSQAAAVPEAKSCGGGAAPASAALPATPAPGSEGTGGGEKKCGADGKSCGGK